MKHVVLPVAALCTGVAALLLSWLSLDRERDPDDRAARAHAAADLDAARLRSNDLEARLGRMDDELAKLKAASSSDRITTRRMDPDSEGRAQLFGRLSELEARVAELARRSTPHGPMEVAETRVPDPLDVSKAIDAWQQTARNASASEKDRLAALGQLRGARLPDNADARLPVLEDMIRLAETSADPATRADVWRQLSHVTERSMLPPLLAALHGDSSEEVREEAAETLADFLPDEAAQRALRQAAENDQSPRVRSQAWESLGVRGR